MGFRVSGSGRLMRSRAAARPWSDEAGHRAAGSEPWKCVVCPGRRTRARGLHADFVLCGLCWPCWAHGGVLGWTWAAPRWW
jgi:hypothetical protein